MHSKIVRQLLSLLVDIRLTRYAENDAMYGLRVGRASGFISALRASGAITFSESFDLDRLVSNAIDHMGHPFPVAANAGPVMPLWVELERKHPVKLSARVPADEQQVSAPSPHTGLRLLCLLVPSRTGETRSLPVHTMRPMPPLVLRAGRWSMASDPAFVLREAHAVRPTAEVLERCSRQRQANAVCANSRTVRTEGVSYLRLPS